MWQMIIKRMNKDNKDTKDNKESSNEVKFSSDNKNELYKIVVNSSIQYGKQLCLSSKYKDHRFFVISCIITRHTRCGIGTKFMNELISLAKNKGLGFCLYGASTMSGIAFAEKLGLVKDGSFSQYIAC